MLLIGWFVNEFDFGGEVLSMNFGSLWMIYLFINNFFFEVLIQYNDVVDLIFSNLCFLWLQRLNIGFFVVYNDNCGIGVEGVVFDCLVIVKFFKFFDVFD